MLATSLVSSSAAILISFIGFSEILAFLPMINLQYPLRLEYFFKGISGLNFQMYDFSSRLNFLPFKESAQPMGKRFNNAGFEFKYFLLNSTDIFFLYFITLANFCLFKILQKLFANWSKGSQFVDKKIKLFKLGNFIELFMASFMILFLCASLNVKKMSFSNWLESLQSVISIIIFDFLSLTPLMIAVFIHNRRNLIAN